MSSWNITLKKVAKVVAVRYGIEHQTLSLFRTLAPWTLLCGPRHLNTNKLLFIGHSFYWYWIRNRNPRQGFSAFCCQVQLTKHPETGGKINYKLSVSTVFLSSGLIESNFRTWFSFSLILNLKWSVSAFNNSS